MAAMMHLWTCVRCTASVTGPARPRRAAACRSCPSCTEETGTAVARERGAALGRPAPKRMPNEAPTVWRGLDLQAECDRLAELEIVPRRLQLRPPLVELRRVPRIAPNGADGYAYLGLNRISITVWPACHMARTLSTLAHELAHLWCGRKHDDYWRSSYIELIREGYGIDPDMPTRDATWALDLAVERALARHLQAPDNPNPNPNPNPNQTRKKK